LDAIATFFGVLILHIGLPRLGVPRNNSINVVQLEKENKT